MDAKTMETLTGAEWSWYVSADGETYRCGPFPPETPAAAAPEVMA